jgi:hypothetical protein
MLRVIALALSLMLSLGAIIPLATNYSEAGPKQSYKKKKKKYKKYSRAWWHQYRKNQKRKRAIAARKRALKARQQRLAKQRLENLGDAPPLMKSAGKSGKANQKTAVRDNSAPAILPSGESAPRTWKRGQDSRGELQFRVDDEGGKQIGAASLSVVGPAMGADDNGARGKTVGGVSTGALRRTVIDRMMKEEGWVVNDYQKDLGGKKVYVVVAQSKGAAGQIQSRIFYFTEVEGKIYSLSTNAPNEASERLAQESEKVINSLQRVNRPTQAELR